MQRNLLMRVPQRAVQVWLPVIFAVLFTLLCASPSATAADNTTPVDVAAAAKINVDSEVAKLQKQLNNCSE